MKYLIQSLLFVWCLTFFACDDDQSNGEQTKLPTVVATGNPAIDGLSEQIAAKPADHKLLAKRAAAYYQEEGYDEAIADMANALRLDSTNIEYHYLLADIYLDYYKSQQALFTLERAVNLDPQNVNTILKLAEFQLFLKQYENSLENIEKVLKINPLNTQAYILMGKNFEDKKDKTKAIAAYQTAIENDPSLAEVHMKLGQLFAQDGNKIALRYFENAAAAAPASPMPLYAKAEYLHNNDRLDDALEALKQTILIDRQFVEAYFRSGIIYIEKDSLQKAQKQFDLVVLNDPTSAKGFYYRGWMAELQGNTANAKADFEQALAFAPDLAAAKEGLERLKK